LFAAAAVAAGCGSSPSGQAPSPGQGTPGSQAAPASAGATSGSSQAAAPGSATSPAPDLLPAVWTAAPKNPPSVLTHPIPAAVMLVTPREWVKFSGQPGGEWRDVDQVLLLSTGDAGYRLLPGATQKYPVVLSPDGRWVAWTPASGTGLTLLSVPTGEVRTLPAGTHSGGEWFTPDGQSLRWVQRPADGVGNGPAPGTLVRYQLSSGQVTSREPLPAKVFPIGELADGTLVLHPLSAPDARGRVLPTPKELLDYTLTHRSDSGPGLYPSAWSPDARRWVMPTNVMILMPSEMASPQPDHEAPQRTTVIDATALTTTTFGVPGNDGFITWLTWAGEQLYGIVDEPLHFESTTGDTPPPPAPLAVAGKDRLRKVIRFDLTSHQVTVLAQGPIRARPFALASALVT